MRLFLFVAAILFAGVSADDNGLAVTPPMGWRSWNQYQCGISQGIMEASFLALNRYAAAIWNGSSLTLRQLGYSDAGLDDCYQLCGSYGPQHYTYHDPANAFQPAIDLSKFPNMSAMTAVAHAEGLTAGFYSNNCACKDDCSDPACIAGDVDFMLRAGFDSLKADSCGLERDIQLWRDMLNFSSSKPILLENCHNGPLIPTADSCPFHTYRSSTDIRPVHGSILANLQTIVPLAAQNLSRSGCWAYPDMLEVGVTNTQNASLPPLSLAESRAHFSAWAIVSSPLVLGLNFSDIVTLESVWPIITNTEAIAVNQQYAGESGTIFYSSNATTAFAPCGWWLPSCAFPSQQYLYKPLPGGDIALLLMNNAAAPADITLELASIPGWPSTAYGAGVRDIWAHATLPAVRGTISAAAVGSRDVAFYRLTPQA